MSWSDPRDLAEAAKIAETLGNCPLLPPDLRNPQAIFLIIGYADSLRINPFSALRSVQIIKGKPTLSADGLAGVVLGSGLVEQWSYDECTDDRCRITAQRNGMAPFSVEWTRERARQAGLGGQQWERYPRQMLRARAISEAARQGWPDVCAGVYEPSEIAEEPTIRDKTIAIAQRLETELPKPEPVKTLQAETEPKEDLKELAAALIEQLRSKGLDEPDRALRSETQRIAGPGVTITAEHITAAYDVLWAGLDSMDQDRR